MLTDVGPAETKLFRDVAGTFEPVIVKTRQQLPSGEAIEETWARTHAGRSAS